MHDSNVSIAAEFAAMAVTGPGGRYHPFHDGSAQEAKELVDRIRGASEEQARGTQQVSSTLAQMEPITQQNSAGAEQSASASQQLFRTSLRCGSWWGAWYTALAEFPLQYLHEQYLPA